MKMKRSKNKKKRFWGLHAQKRKEGERNKRNRAFLTHGDLVVFR